MFKVDNAIIMAAGTSSRFAPLSYEKPKGLVEVKGEILVERQIRQLREAGIEDIVLITGYKAEMYDYLKEKFHITLVHNPDYLVRNNNSSIHVVKDFLHNSYVCSVDNYFKDNPFEAYVDDSYYAAQYANGETKEWVLTEDQEGYIDSVTVGGKDAWYMMGHTFWSETYSQEFIEILESIYDDEKTKDMLWEDIYMEHLDTLKMKIRKYPEDEIFEFDTLDELRQFDPSYITNTRSHILKNIASKLNITEKDIVDIQTIKDETNEAVGCQFNVYDKRYQYLYGENEVTLL